MLKFCIEYFSLKQALVWKLSNNDKSSGERNPKHSPGENVGKKIQNNAFAFRTVICFVVWIYKVNLYDENYSFGSDMRFQ